MSYDGLVHAIPLNLADLLVLAEAKPDPLPLSDDGEKVAASLKDPNAFVHLVKKYERLVYATALRMVGDREEARDLSQEAFVRAHRALATFDQSRSFAPWICTITANLARDWLRSPGRWRHVLGLLPHLPQAATQIPDPVEEQELSALLGGAILKLKPKIRQAVVLRFVSGLSVKDVALALGVSESAAKMRLSRGLDLLRKDLGEAGLG
jgi:RNA polymerase sigma-70 factor (ECF subfamily)